MYLTIGTHFCGGEVVEKKIVLGKADLDCGMSELHEGCHHSEFTYNSNSCIASTPCCENEYQTIETPDDFIKDFTIPFLNIDFAATFLFAYWDWDLQPELTENLYADYFPPLYEKDIQSLFQTFLN